jgi:hypothetical protein
VLEGGGKGFGDISDPFLDDLKGEDYTKDEIYNIEFPVSPLKARRANLRRSFFEDDEE